MSNFDHDSDGEGQDDSTFGQLARNLSFRVEALMRAISTRGLIEEFALLAGEIVPAELHWFFEYNGRMFRVPASAVDIDDVARLVGPAREENAADCLAIEEAVYAAAMELHEFCRASAVGGGRDDAQGQPPPAQGQASPDQRLIVSLRRRDDVPGAGDPDTSTGRP